MLAYFPLTSDRYEMPMNAGAGVVSLIEVEPDRYGHELALKDEILAGDGYGYYFRCPPDALPLAWEAIEILLPDMARNLPQYFSLEISGREWLWTNRLRGESPTRFILGDVDSLPLPPLDWLGRQVQEDLILMAENADGESICAAGHLCFGSAWCLGDKIGQSFLRVHDPVPEFRERIGAPSDLLMRRLKADRSVGRLNWTVGSTDQLNLAPKLALQWRPSRYGITLENAGERVFFRVERQTLTRLPVTHGILFTIHTYVNPLSEVVADPERLRLLTGAMADYPESMKAYKGMAPYYDALMEYLRRQLLANQ